MSSFERQQARAAEPTSGKEDGRSPPVWMPVAASATGSATVAVPCSSAVGSTPTPKGLSCKPLGDQLGARVMLARLLLYVKAHGNASQEDTTMDAAIKQISTQFGHAMKTITRLAAMWYL